MLIGTRENEFLSVEACRGARVDIDDGEGYAPLPCRLDQVGHVDSGVKAQQRVLGPIASYSERPSDSHTCGVRQPGTVDGVNSDMEKAGWAIRCRR